MRNRVRKRRSGLYEGAQFSPGPGLRENWDESYGTKGRNCTLTYRETSIFQVARGQSLVLNGAGVRTQLVFRIYVAALYLPARLDSGEDILHENQPRRLLLHMLRDVPSSELATSMNETLNATLTRAERQPLESRIRQFNVMLEALRDVKPGTQIVIDYAPDSGTTILVDGEQKGHVPGADFNQALLRMWIGSRPRDAQLKTALLGGGH